MNLKQNENTKEKRRRTLLTYTRGEKTLAYSSLLSFLAKPCSIYRQKKYLEGETRPCIEDRREDLQECRENAEIATFL